MPAPLRPGFGPSLPALLHDRFGIAQRTAAVGIVVVLAVLAGGGVLAWWLSRDPQLTHRGDPVFNLVYDDTLLHEVAAREGELARLVGRRGRVFVAIDVRPLVLEPYEGDVAKGLLPVHAELYVEERRRRDPTFALREEGRSTVNESPGYQVAYRTGSAAERRYWREIFVVPDEERPRRGVIIRFENRRPARIGVAASELIDAAKSAYRSFTFGTDRA